MLSDDSSHFYHLAWFWKLSYVRRSFSTFVSEPNLWKKRLSPYCHYKYSSNTAICCIRTLRRFCSRQTRVIWYSPSTSLCQVTWKRFFIFTFLHSAANWCNIYSETVEAKSSTLELFGKKKFVETTWLVCLTWKWNTEVRLRTGANLGQIVNISIMKTSLV